MNILDDREIRGPEDGEHQDHKLPQPARQPDERPLEILGRGIRGLGWDCLIIHKVFSTYNIDN